MKSHKSPILLFTALLAVILCEAQSQPDAEIIKLNGNVLSAKTQEGKAEAFNKLGLFWYNKNLDTATLYYEKAYKISKKARYKKGLFDYASNMGNVYLYQGKYIQLKELMESALILAREYNDKHYEAVLVTNMGNAYMYNSEYNDAITFFQNGIKLFNENNEPKYIKNINNYISVCFLNSENPDKSIEYAGKTYLLSEKAKDSSLMCSALITLGKAYIEKREFSKAKPFTEKAFLLATKLNLGNEIADSKFDKSRILFAEEKYNDAIYWCNSSNKYYEETGNIISRVNCLCDLSLSYLKIGDQPKAFECIRKAETLAKENNLASHLLFVNNTFSRIYKETGNYKEAYNYLEKFMIQDDSINSEALKNKLQESDAKFQSSEKDRNILLLEKSQLKQKVFIYSLGIIASGLLLFSFLLYRNYKAGKKISEQKIVQLQQERELDAAQNILEGEESERTRLAKDLHDGLGGMLSGIKHSFSTMKGNLILTPENHQAFERSLDMLDSSIREMRRVAHNMMPEALVRFGLDTALNDFCNEISQSGALKINYQSIGLEGFPIEQTTAIMLYRIVQELVNNTMKHARATSAIVQLIRSNGNLSVTVEDDGKGFDTSILKLNKGIGWINIQNRVDFLKGKLDIRSETGEGTSVQIELNV
jgi:two-component system, NarL family, sensor kinase